MAKENQRKTGGRAKVDARDTFDFTTPNAQVSARPTDPYIDQGPVNNDTANTIAAIGKTAETYVTAQESMKQGNAKQAQVDQAQGKNASGDFNIFNIGLGYNETWDTMDGEARAISVAADYHKALESSGYFMNSEDPAKERNAAWQAANEKHFTEGHISEYTKFGAHERLLEAKAKGDLGAFNLQVDLSNQAFASNQMKIVDDMMNRTDDPTAIKQGMENLWAASKDTGAQTRDQNTNMNITSIHNRINTLVQTAPKTMGYAEKTEAVRKALSILSLPDASGATWGQIIDPNTGAPKFASRIHAIINEADASLKEAKRVHMDYMEDAFIEGTTGLGSAGFKGVEGKTRVETALEWQEELYKNGDMYDQPFLAAQNAKLQQIVDGGGFPLVSDAKVYRKVFNSISDGNAVNLAQHVNDLSEQQYDELSRMQVAEKRRDKTTDGREIREVNNKLLSNIDKAAVGNLVGDPLFKATPEGLRRSGEAQELFRSFLYENPAATRREKTDEANRIIKEWNAGSLMKDADKALVEAGVTPGETMVEEAQRKRAATKVQSKSGHTITRTPGGRPK